ncbi:MAG: hypothetical protein ACXW4C_11385 [Nitrospira sp.]
MTTNFHSQLLTPLACPPTAASNSSLLEPSIVFAGDPEHVTAPLYEKEREDLLGR